MNKGSEVLNVDSINIKSIENLSTGFLKTERITFSYTRFDGDDSGSVVRERVLRGNAVHVLIVDIKNKLVCATKQIRPCAIDTDKPYMIEVVAGMIDEDETPIQAAIREAQEEVGVELNPSLISYLGPPMFTAPGSLTEKTNLMLAYADLSDVQEIGGMDTESEDIQVIVRTFSEFNEMVENGTVRDLPSVCAWMISFNSLL